MLVFPGLAVAQTVKKADLVGGWKAELEYAEPESTYPTRGGTSRASLVLWPDGLWWYGGPFMNVKHGGARWRLVGDTLWLGNDYSPYFHPMIAPRILAIQEKGYGLGVMDMDIINQRPPYPVPDSVYWSKAFRDAGCLQNPGRCGTWVYKVSKRGQRLYLVRLDSLSKETESVAIKAVLKRDSLLKCSWLSGCK
jgi:hypothetical protein